MLLLFTAGGEQIQFPDSAALMWRDCVCKELASSRRGMRSGSDGISGPAVFEDSSEQIHDRMGFVTDAFPSHISLRSQGQHYTARG